MAGTMFFQKTKKVQAEENTKIFDVPAPREDSGLFSLGEKSRVQMIFMLSPGEITPNPSQPRRFFTEDAILRLADSIRIHGIIQPLAVRRPEGGSGYRSEEHTSELQSLYS